MSHSSNGIADRIGELGLGVSQPEKKDRNELGQKQFFELMIAQLKQQDPLKPMESNEFLSQLAQFSTVQGIGSIEQSMSSLAGAMQSSQALQASSLVGREVLIPSAIGELEAGRSLNGRVELSSGTGNLEVVITDPAGRPMRTLPLGTQAAGAVDFAWDGITDGGEHAAPGRYEIAVRKDGASSGDSAILVRSRVASVTLQKSPSAVMLNLPGLGSIDVNEVRELL